MLPHIHLEDLRPNHRRPKAHEWWRTHEAIRAHADHLGLPLTLVPSRTPPDPEATDRIFIGLHSRHDGPDCWNVKKSYLRHTAWFDPCGYAGWSELARCDALPASLSRIDDARADAILSPILAETIATNVSKVPQPETPYSPPDGPHVFLPMQLSYDNVMKLSRMDYRGYYEALRDWTRARGLGLVLKAHPLAAGHPRTGAVDPVSRAVLEDAALHAHVTVTEASIHRIIPAADAVFCINSGVGFEALLHGKPVFTAGHCDYHWATRALHDLQDIARIDDWQTPRLSPAETRRFLAWMLSDVLIDTRDASAVAARLDHAIARFHARRDQSTH